MWKWKKGLLGVGGLQSTKFRICWKFLGKTLMIWAKVIGENVVTSDYCCAHFQKWKCSGLVKVKWYKDPGILFWKTICRLSMMCIVEIQEMDIIFINETITKEPKQTKTKTFCSTLKRTFLIGSSKVKIFLELFVWGRINSLFNYKFVILLGCQPQ